MESVQLHTELLDMIVLETNDVFYSVVMRSPFTYKQLVTKDKGKEENLAQLAKDLVTTHPLPISDIFYLKKIDKDAITSLVSASILYATYQTFTRIMRFITTSRDHLPRHFNEAIQSCSKRKIDYFLHELQFVPENVLDLRPLKRYAELVTHISESVPLRVLSLQEIVSQAVDVNNLQCILTLENKHNLDLRRYITSRDLSIAAHKGHLSILQWYHEICNCFPTNFIKCIINDSIYDTSLRSRQNHVCSWLENDTNCIAYNGGSRYPKIEFHYGGIPP